MWRNMKALSKNKTIKIAEEVYEFVTPEILFENIFQLSFTIFKLQFLIFYISKRYFLYFNESHLNEWKYCIDVVILTVAKRSNHHMRKCLTCKNRVRMKIQFNFSTCMKKIRKIWNKSENFPAKIFFIDRHFSLPRETFPCSNINTTEREQRSKPYTFLSRPPSKALRKWWKYYDVAHSLLLTYFDFFPHQSVLNRLLD